MTKEKALEILNRMDDYDLLMKWNEYSDSAYMGDTIYLMDEFLFDDHFSSCEDAVRAVYYGDFNYGDKYVCFNGYGNLVSFCDLRGKKSPVYLDELADYLCETYNEEDF